MKVRFSRVQRNNSYEIWESNEEISIPLDPSGLRGLALSVEDALESVYSDIQKELGDYVLNMPLGQSYKVDVRAKMKLRMLTVPLPDSQDVMDLELEIGEKEPATV